MLETPLLGMISIIDWWGMKVSIPECSHPMNLPVAMAYDMMRSMIGSHPKVVQERLGHSDISLTLNTYSYVLPGMQAEAAGKLEELLSSIDVSDELRKLTDMNPPLSFLRLQ